MHCQSVGKGCAVCVLQQITAIIITLRLNAKGGIKKWIILSERENCWSQRVNLMRLVMCVVQLITAIIILLLIVIPKYHHVTPKTKVFYFQSSSYSCPCNAIAMVGISLRVVHCQTIRILTLVYLRNKHMTTIKTKFWLLTGVHLFLVLNFLHVSCNILKCELKNLEK